MIDRFGRVAATLVHLSLDPLVGLVAVTLLTIGLAFTASFAITVVGGAFFLAATLWAFLGFGRFERTRAAALLGEQIAPPAHNQRPHRFGFVGRLLTDAVAWRSLAYGLIQPIVGSVLFAVVVSWWSAGLVGVTLPLYIEALPADTARLYFFDVDTSAEIAAVVLAGVVGLAIAPVLTLAAGQVDLALIRGLLGQSHEAEIAQLQADVVQVDTRRMAALDAAEAERRRIERDLHDGAQQRLVSLGMTLGLAREKLDQDPEQARALLDEAHAEAKSAMTELRAIARGIHPAILDDRGLDAALSALAARSPVPVIITVRLTERLGTTLEGAAYYVVAEALTNVAKHANAHTATVDVQLRQDTVVIEVSDDGVGGATARPDGGIAGLANRVAALGGRLTLSSPAAGPTTLTVELPRDV